MKLKQTIYPHGGSRIYLEDDDERRRSLLADTYAIIEDDKSFAIAVRDFVDKYLQERPELTQR